MQPPAAMRKMEAAIKMARHHEDAERRKKVNNLIRRVQRKFNKKGKTIIPGRSVEVAIYTALVNEGYLENDLDQNAS